ADAHGRRLASARVLVDHATGHRPTGELDEELSGPVESEANGLRVASALEAVRAFGVQAVTPGAATDAGRVEVGTFEENASGRLGDLGILAAHHAAEHERAFGIGDHQVVGGEYALLAIEGDEALSLPGGADADPRGANAV